MKSILFDLDGTLVNSSPGIKAAFNYAFEKLQLLFTDRQTTVNIHRSTFRSHFWELFRPN